MNLRRISQLSPVNHSISKKQQNSYTKTRSWDSKVASYRRCHCSITRYIHRIIYGLQGGEKGGGALAEEGMAPCRVESEEGAEDEVAQMHAGMRERKLRRRHHQ